MKAKKSPVLEVLYEPPGPKTKKRIRVATALSVGLLLFFLYRILLRFYLAGQLSGKYWMFFAKLTTWKFLGKGLWGTIKVAAAAGCVTLAMGFFLMLGRISTGRAVRWFSSALIAFSRGTPTLLFVYFFFLIVPQFGLQLPAFWKITLPISISAAGVVAEVLRSGVNAVPKGQSEAAFSLGMKKRSVFLKVVFPQAFRFVVPALIAEIVIVLKDTTFAYVVNYADFMQNAKVLISNYDAMLSVYLVTAAVYVVINGLLGKLASFASKRSDRMIGIKV